MASPSKTCWHGVAIAAGDLRTRLSGHLYPQPRKLTMDNSELIAHLANQNMQKDQEIATLKMRLQAADKAVAMLRVAHNTYARSYPSAYDWSNWESQVKHVLSEIDALPDEAPPPVCPGVSDLERATSLLYDARPFIGPTNLNQRVSGFLKERGYPREGETW